MKFVKRALMVLLSIIVILAILPKFLSKHLSLSRKVIINTTVANSFAKLPDLNEFVKWNPFAADDLTNTNLVTGVGVDSSMSWKGEKTGEGKMKITAIEPNHKVKIKLEFFAPFAGTADVNWVIVPTPDGKSELTWSYEQDLPYFNRLIILVMKPQMVKLFDKGLKRYKALIENGM